ncbi:hypothetical protein MOB77_04505 [Bacillus haynesii]|uniref:hypothetical protein n=1 Tax=Bacillus haynesii TaxID=1925021 RepID=UPI00228075B0|nr:hypothetical protein [Bacillus haynesii]MCY8066246.1 hypothetical protein [Bacillus haynesii]
MDHEANFYYKPAFLISLWGIDRYTAIIHLMTGAASGMSGNVIGIFMVALFAARIFLMFLKPSKKMLLLGCL